MADMEARAASPPRILMCSPEHFGIEYEINPWMHVEDGSDPARANAQWNALAGEIRRLGVEIDLIEPVKGLPDLVFTANAGLVYRGIFIASRFRHGVRQGETPHFDAWARSRGFEVVEIPGEGHFEGAGDALFCGETLFGGYRLRSDARCLQWIGERLGVSVLPLELVDPHFYHLDTCFCPIDRDSAIYYPAAFDDYGRTVLRGRVRRLIEVSPEEAASFSCNAVVIGRTVLLNDGAPKLAADLASIGFDVIPLAFGEFIKSGGSAKCLTLRVDGEDAAAWRS